MANKQGGKDVDALYQKLGMDSSRYRHTRREAEAARKSEEAASRWPLLGEIQGAVGAEPDPGSVTEAPATEPAEQPRQASEAEASSDQVAGSAGEESITQASQSDSPQPESPAIDSAQVEPSTQEQAEEEQEQTPTPETEQGMASAGGGSTEAAEHAQPQAPVSEAPAASEPETQPPGAEEPPQAAESQADSRWQLLEELGSEQQKTVADMLGGDTPEEAAPQAEPEPPPAQPPQSPEAAPAPAASDAPQRPQTQAFATPPLSEPEASTPAPRVDAPRPRKRRLRDRLLGRRKASSPAPPDSRSQREPNRPNADSLGQEAQLPAQPDPWPTGPSLAEVFGLPESAVQPQTYLTGEPTPASAQARTTIPQPVSASRQALAYLPGHHQASDTQLDAVFARLRGAKAPSEPESGEGAQAPSGLSASFARLRGGLKDNNE